MLQEANNHVNEVLLKVAVVDTFAVSKSIKFRNRSRFTCSYYCINLAILHIHTMLEGKTTILLLLVATDKTKPVDDGIINSANRKITQKNH